MSICTYEAADGWKCQVRPRDGSSRCSKHRAKIPRAPPKPIIPETIDEELHSLKSNTDNELSDDESELKRIDPISDDEAIDGYN